MRSLIVAGKGKNYPLHKIIGNFSFRTLYTFWSVQIYFKDNNIVFSLYYFSNRNTRIEEKVGPDSRNTVEKNQTVLKEFVSQLVKNEEEKEKEEEGMKLRRRSKIKVSVLFFRPVSFLYFVFLVV